MDQRADLWRRRAHSDIRSGRYSSIFVNDCLRPVTACPDLLCLPFGLLTFSDSCLYQTQGSSHGDDSTHASSRSNDITSSQKGGVAKLGAINSQNG